MDVEKIFAERFANLKIKKIYLHKNYRTNIEQEMNKPITKEFSKRATKCVFDTKNKVNFYESTGIHWSTLQRIIDRGWADEEQIEKIEKYCDEVEGITSNEGSK